MSTDADPLVAWEHEIDELSFTVNLPLLEEPAAIRAVCARIARYMDHFDLYRAAVQAVAGLTEGDANAELRDAVRRRGQELQTTAPGPGELSMQMNTLTSLVRVELERERAFVEKVHAHLDAAHLHALIDELSKADEAKDQGSSSDGDDSWATAPTQVDPKVDRSIDAVIERSITDE